jgi:uncharacterized membrane protein YdjX (TVP38/TMEM64 family)
MQTAERESVGQGPATRDNRPRWTRWALAGLLVLAVAGFYALGLYRYLAWDYLRGHLDALQAQVHDHLALALLLFFLVYVTVTALSLPVAAPLTLVAGALFGRWLATGVVSLASTLGATLAFLSSRYLFRDYVQRKFGDRLQALNEGVERDGAYYLFTLRLVPAFPFFLVNLGMGLTPIRLGTYVWVSWLGMLPGTFVYANAGTAIAAVDSPKDVLSPGVLVSFALLGLLPLGLRLLLHWKGRVPWRWVGAGVGGLLLVAAAAAGLRAYFRYHTADTMEVAVREYSNAEYPEDPADRSPHFGQYNGRRLVLVKKDETHFDFVLEPSHPHAARVVFKDVDVSLMTPGLPEWTKADAGLRRIALTDRQWNRQQVAFGGPGSAHVEVTGGDGFEAQQLASAELAKNCLNAGLWEALLFTNEDGGKALYYQCWFTFPLGHYKELFERTTGLPYWRHWYYLEHWFDPDGTPLPLEKLRQVRSERGVPARFDPAGRVAADGEQVRKRRTTLAENVRTWGDFFDGEHRVRFATFIPPGRYSVGHPWKNGYDRMNRPERAVLREVVSPAGGKPLAELELVFASTRREGLVRFLVSGFDPEKLPRLAPRDYGKTVAATASEAGVFAYMPMGIGTPPFFQTYAELEKAPPDRSSFFSVTLDSDGRWINHHELAIDGPVMHRDEKDPNLLHVYLLSYERHTLIGHWAVSTGK